MSNGAILTKIAFIPGTFPTSSCAFQGNGSMHYLRTLSNKVILMSLHIVCTGI